MINKVVIRSMVKLMACLILFLVFEKELFLHHVNHFRTQRAKISRAFTLKNVFVTGQKGEKIYLGRSK